MFADVASPGTVANLLANPAVEINVVDPILRRGYRFRGTAQVHRDGPVFEQALARLRAEGFTTARERIKSLVIVAVDEAEPLVSPAYDTGATEASIRDRWLNHHNALHCQR